MCLNIFCITTTTTKYNRKVYDYFTVRKSDSLDSLTKVIINQL